MRNCHWKHVAVGVALVAVMAGLPTSAAAAGRISAKINGRPVKWRGHYVVFGFDPNTGFAAVATKIRGLKTIAIGCPVSPDTLRVHVPASYCVAIYSQGRLSQRKTWSTEIGSQFPVTFDSFDGRTVSGTFGGSVPALPFQGDGTTITLEGTFRGPIQQ